MNRRSFLKRASAAVPVAALAMQSQPEKTPAPPVASRVSNTARLTEDVSPGDILQWDDVQTDIHPWRASKAQSSLRLAGIAGEYGKAGDVIRLAREGYAWIAVKP